MPYSELILIVAILIGATGFFVLGRWRSGGPHETISSGTVPRYQVRRSLLNSRELALYKILRKIYAGRGQVCPKVRLTDMLEHPGYESTVREHWFRVHRRSIDFVICDDHFLPLLAIKLSNGGRRHTSATTDDVLEDCLAAADVPLLKLRAKNEYQLGDVLNRIRFAMAGDDIHPRVHQAEYIFVDGELDDTTERQFSRLRRWISDLWEVARTR